MEQCVARERALQSRPHLGCISAASLPPITRLREAGSRVRREARQRRLASLGRRRRDSTRLEAGARRMSGRDRAEPHPPSTSRGLAWRAAHLEAGAERRVERRAREARHGQTDDEHEEVVVAADLRRGERCGEARRRLGTF